MKKSIIPVILLVFLLLLCLPAKAGDRWMVGLNGSVPLNKWAPDYSAGVEMSCFLLDAGPFRFGPGIGLFLAEPVYRPWDFIDDRSLYLPVFVRGVYIPELGGRLKPFVALDAGYTFDLIPPGEIEYNGRINAMFFTPQAGLNLGKRFYAALGVWCQWIGQKYIDNEQERISTRYELLPSLSMKLGVRF